MTRSELEQMLNISTVLISKGKKNRPGTPLVPTYITIHNTDNANEGADAGSHGRFLANTGYYMWGGKKKWISWHYTVDDGRVVRHLPLGEQGYHSSGGNSKSFGIEICMNKGIDQEEAFRRAARLAALLLYDHDTLKKDVRRVVPHYHWTRKNCPRLLLNNGKPGKRWEDFLAMIEQELKAIT
jgi:N-acetylmuramoyl-L-alanine amidase